MNTEAEKLAEKIKELVDRLVIMADRPPESKGTRKVRPAGSTKGASGAISLLIKEGFFDTPKELTSVMSKMEGIGRYYPPSTVSMNLLNLTKRRTLNRLRDKKSGNWKYVVRR